MHVHASCSLNSLLCGRSLGRHILESPNTSVADCCLLEWFCDLPSVCWFKYITVTARDVLHKLQ